jgi:2-polyprenyl-3-methyl-5-hydroxy-6-metoxy-1,4-benzoquinol methylase
MLKRSYQKKERDYYKGCRSDILNLLPLHVNRILEIGCGTGDTLAYLKAHNYCEWTCGVDLFCEAITEAATKIDLAYEENIEKMELQIEKNSIDIILCLDVLEHLVNPLAVVEYLHTLLVPNGIMIASIPNIGYLSVGLRLLLLDSWEYQEKGILDETHLRFFVRKTAIELMESSGLSVVDIQSHPLTPRNALINTMTLGLFKNRLTTQYLIKAINQ